MENKGHDVTNTAAMVAKNSKKVGSGDTHGKVEVAITEAESNQVGESGCSYPIDLAASVIPPTGQKRNFPSDSVSNSSTAKRFKYDISGRRPFRPESSHGDGNPKRKTSIIEKITLIKRRTDENIEAISRYESEMISEIMSKAPVSIENLNALSMKIDEEIFSHGKNQELIKYYESLRKHD